MNRRRCLLPALDDVLESRLVLSAVSPSSAVTAHGLPAPPVAPADRGAAISAAFDRFANRYVSLLAHTDDARPAGLKASTTAALRQLNSQVARILVGPSDRATVRGSLLGRGDSLQARLATGRGTAADGSLGLIAATRRDLLVRLGLGPVSLPIAAAPTLASEAPMLDPKLNVAEPPPVTPTPETIPQRPILSGRFGGIRSDQQLVIRDAAAWQQFFGQLASTSIALDGTPPTPPAVDFDTEMVVAVVIARNTTGYGVAIDSITSSGGLIAVHYTETTPSLAGAVGQALTQPFVLVAIPRSDGPVNFTHAVTTGG